MRFLVLLCLVLTSYYVKAQQSWFAFHEYAMPEISPSKIAIDYYAMAALQYKTQKLVGSDHLLSTLLFVKVPVVNHRYNRLALAFAFEENKINGPGNLAERVFSTTLAYSFNYARHRGVSFGMDVGLVSKKIDLTGIQTDEMWTFESGFDPTLSSGENLQYDKYLYPTINSSLYWFINDKNDDPVFYAGLSVFQLNKERDSFYAKDSQYMNSRLTLIGGLKVYDKERVALIPKIAFYTESSRYYAKVGVDFNYSLARYKNQISRAQNSLNIEMNYQLDKGVQFGVRFLQPKLVIGMAYHMDVAVQQEKNVFNNAVEVLILVRNPVPIKNPGERNRRSRNRRSISKKEKNQLEEKNKKQIEKLGTPGKAIEAEPNSTINEQPVVPDSLETSPMDSTKLMEPGSEGEPVDKNWETIVQRGAENTLRFDYNSTDINTEAYNKLVQLAQLLKTYPNAKIILVGHTDDIGSPTRNMSFSIKRAKAAAKILEEMGVSSKRIIVQGKGETEPIDTNSTDEGRSNNRRIEYFIIN